ncbi:PorT family protein [Pedobacter sp. SD-b]|uniref:PorT family protein n=1 Tax=Pedobacter segetis TaxID=2793069 RepID=A0ABS1BIL5_9SPHI|nr:porin family protein [Pedobacter segetis]MBK0382729.1 PorT family protein [Pedobacter segetis]
MKKIFLAIVLCLGTTLIFAQQQDTFKGFKLGLTAHPTFGYIKSDIQGVDGDGLRAGFTYGLLGDFYFAQNYAFSTALKLTTINGQTKETATNEQKIYKLQYIEIPATVKLCTSETNGLKFFGQFGLGNAFNVRAKQDIKGLSSEPVQTDVDIYKNISFYRASLIIGAGAEFAAGEKTKLAGGLTFDNGFTDIKSGSGTLKSSYIGLTLAVYF